LTLLYVAPIKLSDSHTLYLDIPKSLAEVYPHILYDINVEGFRALWFRAYSNEGRVIVEPYKEIELKTGSHYETYKVRDKVVRHYVKHVEVTDLVKSEGLGKGYIMEIHFLSFIRKEPYKGAEEIPIFPNELRVEVDESVPYRIKEEVEMERILHEEISSEIEAIGLLKNIGLRTVAEDLRNALIRYRRQDWEGSIKFFRKVVESFKTMNLKELDLGVEERKDILKRLINASYSLLSNFGEHAGTQGRRPEAKFAKELTVALAHYIAQYAASTKKVKKEDNTKT